MEKTATPVSVHITEDTHHEAEEGEVSGTSEFTMAGVANVGSELERVHIAEKNKAMAAKLKVRRRRRREVPAYIPLP